MWSNCGRFSLVPKKEAKDLTSFPIGKNSSLENPIDISSSPSSSSPSSSSTSLDDDLDNENNLSTEDASKQLVLYDPVANGSRAIELVTNPLQYKCPLHPRSEPQNSIPRVLPEVGAFTVQCANCFKWRLIPTKEKYEEIREHILERPFSCETACEWRPDVSCDDPEDISQDGSRLWAIDKPSIAQPPPGWERLLKIRGEGSTKFADIYYVAPTGKRLRSIVEIQKYLLQHPEYATDGLTLSRFSFQIPRPLQDNYVRKRSVRITAPYEGNEPAQAEQGQRFQHHPWIPLMLTLSATLRKNEQLRAPFSEQSNEVKAEFYDLISCWLYSLLAGPLIAVWLGRTLEWLVSFWLFTFWNRLVLKVKCHTEKNVQLWIKCILFGSDSSIGLQCKKRSCRAVVIWCGL